MHPGLVQFFFSSKNPPLFSYENLNETPELPDKINREMFCARITLISTCSDMCLHIRGSVWMKREQVLFFLSSFGLVALRVLLWLGSLASLEYLWPGDSWSPFHGFTTGGGSDFFSVTGRSSSGSAEFCILSIHSTTSSVMPQPPVSPSKKKKTIINQSYRYVISRAEEETNRISFPIPQALKKRKRKKIIIKQYHIARGRRN